MTDLQIMYLGFGPAILTFFGAMASMPILETWNGWEDFKKQDDFWVGLVLCVVMWIALLTAAFLVTKWTWFEAGSWF